MPPLRIYTDTSVIGGCLDAKFARDSRLLFKLIAEGRFTLLISQVVLDELADAPPSVRKVLESLPAESIEFVPLAEEIIKLRDAYLKAGIVRPRWVDDATHVAAATVANADAIVSWNFRHIVRLDRIGLYNDVNQRQGYERLVIVTPLEVTRGIEDEKA